MAQRYEYDLFQGTSRSEIERWVEDIETNAAAGRRHGGIDPLSGKQLVWLRQIWDRAEG